MEVDSEIQAAFVVCDVPHPHARLDNHIPMVHQTPIFYRGALVTYFFAFRTWKMADHAWEMILGIPKLSGQLLVLQGTK